MSLLLDAALQATLLTGLALVATQVMARASAAMRHAILAAAVLAVAASPLAMWVLPAWTPWPRWSDPTSHTVVVGTASAAGVSDEETRAIAQPDASGPAAARLAGTLAVVWVAGLLVGVVRVARGVRQLQRVRASAVPCLDASLLKTVSDASTAVGLRRPPTVLLTEQAGLIATWGFRRGPVLVLPMLAAAWPAERVGAVARHECAHIRRRDWAMQMVAEMVRRVHWFNPLVAIACRRLRHASERACDDVVVESGIPARHYAAHLVAVARAIRPARAWSLAMSAAHAPGLERRITAMLNPTLDRRPLTRRAATAIAGLTLAIGLPVAAMQSPQAQDDLRGTVYDSTGAVVPQVAFTLDDAAGTVATATTDAQGQFDFPAVRAGEYTLTAQLPGFQKLPHTFTLSARADWERAITLQLGTLRETVTVSTERKPAAATTDAPAAPSPIRVGGNIRAPRKTHDVKPVYPASMRDAGREGTVDLEAIIGRDGAVHSLRVLGAHVHPDFAIAAAEAARQWVFTPTLLNGEPVDVVMTVSVQFRLTD